MYWIIQNNLWGEEGFNDLINALERFDCPYLVVKTVPFSDRLIPHDYDRNIENLEDIPEPNIPTNTNIIIFGSVTLSKIAKNRGWAPGSFLNENYDFSKWREHYGEHLLNYDSITCRFDEVKFGLTPLFLRPCHDTKAFVGKVFDKEEFEKWRDDVIALSTGHSNLKPETEVAIAPPKQIYREFRFFVVDGELITQSQYKIGNIVRSDAMVESDIIAFAQKMVDIWQPSRAFVIDVALTPDGMRIVEINNINSAGFYKCNVMKIVAAIENMKF